MPITKYTAVQQERVKRLEPALKSALIKGDLKMVKTIIQDLQPIYLSTGNEAKLLLAKNRWLEIEMDSGNLSVAETGLIGIRIRANKKTRMYLEATTLLAICYLRLNNLIKAEPLIREVLINDSVIKSNERRLKFRETVIERFDEEAILSAIKAEKVHDIIFDIDKIASEALDLATTDSEDKLYEQLGFNTPLNAKHILVEVDSFAKKQLPSAERLKLPSPTLSHEDKKVGKTVFSSIKRVIYKSICEKDGELYKKINAGIITIQTSLASAITEILSSINIGIRLIIVGAVALILQLGIKVYCDMFEPVDIMDLR